MITLGLIVLGMIVSAVVMSVIPFPLSVIVLGGLCLGSAWSAMMKAGGGGDDDDEDWTKPKGNEPWVKGERRLMERLANRERSDQHQGGGSGE